MVTQKVYFRQFINQMKQSITVKMVWLLSFWILAVCTYQIPVCSLSCLPRVISGKTFHYVSSIAFSLLLFISSGTLVWGYCKAQ